MSDKNALLAAELRSLADNCRDGGFDTGTEGPTTTVMHIGFIAARHQLLRSAEALAQAPADGSEVRAAVVNTRCDCHPETCCCGDYTLLIDGESVTNGGKENMQNIANAINSRSAAAAPTPAVDDAMVKRAEQVRVETLHKVTAYGSAGVEERYLMAMRDALTAAFAQQAAHD